MKTEQQLLKEFQQKGSIKLGNHVLGSTVVHDRIELRKQAMHMALDNRPSILFSRATDGQKSKAQPKYDLIVETEKIYKYLLNGRKS